MITPIHQAPQGLARRLALWMTIATVTALAVSAGSMAAVGDGARADAAGSSSRPAWAGPGSAPTSRSADLPLDPVNTFGSNPGNLRMWEYLPHGLPTGAPVVVVLHGCGSTPFLYADASGWTTVADAWKFALVLPQQSVLNNPSLCFNWFSDADTSRGKGEAESIRQMVDWMVARRGVDARRVFVTGISAGGAMTASMLGAYPDVFAGGAPVAGMPQGCAHFPAEASFCGQPGRDLSPSEWGDRVRAETGWKGPWPKVSVWQGALDGIVNPRNLTELVEQWTDVHGIDRVPEQVETVAGHTRTVYADDSGTPQVESYLIQGMTHAQPVNPGPGPDECGVAGPFIEDVGVCAAYRISVFWGIAKG
ncbi:MAG: alpha/beta hydrolase family esterase [Actinomycetes bacterium]